MSSSTVKTSVLKNIVVINHAHIGIATALGGGSFGQLAMKSGMQNLQHWQNLVPLHTSFNSAAFYCLAAGILAYLVSMLAWIQTLKKYQLSTAYPILALSYMLVYIGAAYWPGIQEPMHPQKSLGVALITLGVCCCLMPNGFTSRIMKKAQI